MVVLMIVGRVEIVSIAVLLTCAFGEGEPENATHLGLDSAAGSVY